MASSRADSTERHAHPIDPDLHAILVEFDRIRAQLTAYSIKSQERGIQKEKLEADLAESQRELLESRQQIALLHERLTEQRHAPGNRSEAEPEQQLLQAKRELRHVRKVLLDVLNERSSVQASSPSAISAYQPTAIQALGTSTTRLDPNEPTPQKPRTPPPSRAPLGHGRIPGSDMPEPVTAVARTPKVKKAQHLPKAARGQTSAMRRQDTPLSPSGLEMGQTFSSDTTKSYDARDEAEQRRQPEDVPSKTSKRRKASNKGKQKAQPQTSVGYPSDTDVTYYGPDAVDEAEEGGVFLNGKEPRQSSEPRQFEAQESNNQTAGPSQTRDVTTWTLSENVLQQYFVCGSIKESTMLTQTDCPLELIKQLKTARGEDSFRLVVNGECIFLVEPMGLASEYSDKTFIVTWGDPIANMDVRQRIWHDGDRDSVDYHTYIRRRIDKKTQWLYLGKLRWAVTQIVSKWPRANAKMQQEMAKMLQSNWRTDLTIRDITLKIECEQLEEFVVEISRDDDLLALSRSYAQHKFSGAYARSQAMAK